MRQTQVLQKPDVNAVLEYQNPEIVSRYARRHDVSEEEAQHLFEECKKFLVVCSLSKEPCSPSEKLDEMWHHFVLHTRDYTEFCNKFFGKFIHHVPNEEIAGPEIRVEMIRKAEQLFGQLDPMIWPVAVSAVCTTQCDAGDCSSGPPGTE